MIGIKRDLSEETRMQTINIKGECYDLHFHRDLYYICKHGTYEILLCSEKNFFDKAFH